MFNRDVVQRAKEPVNTGIYTGNDKFRSDHELKCITDRLALFWVDTHNLPFVYRQIIRTQQHDII